MRSLCLFLLTALIPLVLFSGCGGGGSTPPPPVTVTISAPQPTVSVGSHLLFTARVNGITNNSAVIWQVDDMTGGNLTVGTIDTFGNYTAPAAIPNPAAVTVKAIAKVDMSKSASAGITVTVGVMVSPASALLPPGGIPEQFTATVSGSSNMNVNWTVNGHAPGDPDTTFGTISTTGLYTPPGAIPDPPEFNVTATAQVDPTQSANAPCTISAGGPGVNQAAQTAPIKLGTSGGNALDTSAGFCCSGTLGALVTRNNIDFILSNNHVLAKSDKGTAGDPISQPGLVDTSPPCTRGQTVANLSQFVNLQTAAMPEDAALAQIVSGQVDTTGAILQLGVVSNGLAQPAPPANTTIPPAIGMAVAKSGRTTGLTCSTIAVIDLSNVQVDYSPSCGSNATAFTVTYNNQIDIVSTSFSAPGDSGSLVVDSDTAQPVGLLFAGTSTDTVANPIQDVLNDLPDPGNKAIPTFVGGATHTVMACTGNSSQGGGGGQNLTAASVTPVANEEVSRARTAKNNHLAALIADPAVLGVGVGAGDDPGAAAVVVFVEKGKAHRPIPATLDGVKTKIRTVERFRALGSCPAPGSAHPAATSLP
ncbi:MAG: S1 family peptidase [Acidobacteriia bacterium]|nr:S1 family peptidase [Terriglobia bacterium]